MKNSTLRRVAVLGASAALLLTGCSDDSEPAASPSTTAGASTTTATECKPVESKEASPLDGVAVSGDVGTAPTVKVEKAVTITEPTVKVVCVGDGEAVKDGQTLSYLYTVVLGTTGEQKGQTATSESGTLSADFFGDKMHAALVDATIGTRLLWAEPASTEGEAPAIIAFEITGARDVPTRATGEAVEPPAGLPTVKLADDGAPTITIPDDYEAPSDLVVQTLVKGSGPAVTDKQTLTVQYAGVKLDGTTFDSSWERGAPATFPLSGVIQGWTKGLAGQTVGSQVLLVIPPSLGYGGTPGHELEKETLVFVVDILEAS